MQTDFIEQIEPTPKLTTQKCKIISFFIRVSLQYSSYILTLFMWWQYDYFIGISAFLLSFIVVGIMRSKLRNSVIPPSQREYQYNDQGIADWYTAKVICY